jgi:site-specific recombinase XerD
MSARKPSSLPLGVTIQRGVYYWFPPTRHEREARKARGETVAVRLAKVGDETTMRIKWAELAGHRDRPIPGAGTVAEILDRYEREELRGKDSRGEPKRKPETVAGYEYSLKVLHEKLGARQYARNEVEASKGTKLRTMDVQSFLREAEHLTMANRHVAVLSNAFRYAKLCGLTEYNPCLGVERHREYARDREVLDDEVDDLVAHATGVLRLVIRFIRITGWRPKDVRQLTKFQISEEGIRLRQSKRGRRQLWAWSAELRAIVAEADELRGALRVKKAAKKRGGIDEQVVFCTRLGKPLTKDGLVTIFDRLRGKVSNARAAAGKPRIDDLVLYDLRAKAGDDAEEQGQQRHKFLGNTPAVADKHYARRTTKLKPVG